MTCLSCEERGKLLKQARDAVHSGDLVTAERILKEVFGTVKMDVRNLTSIVFRTRERGEKHNLKDAAAVDRRDARPEHERKKYEPEGGK